MEINTSVTAAHFLCQIDTGPNRMRSQLVKFEIHQPNVAQSAKKNSPETRALASSQKHKKGILRPSKISFHQRIRFHFLHHWSRPSHPQYTRTSQRNRVGNLMDNVLNPVHKWRARSRGFPPLTSKVRVFFLYFWLIEIYHFQDSRYLYSSHLVYPIFSFFSLFG